MQAIDRNGKSKKDGGVNLTPTPCRMVFPITQFNKAINMPLNLTSGHREYGNWISTQREKSHSCSRHDLSRFTCSVNSCESLTCNIWTIRAAFLDTGFLTMFLWICQKRPLYGFDGCENDIIRVACLTQHDLIMLPLAVQYNVFARTNIWEKIKRNLPT